MYVQALGRVSVLNFNSKPVWKGVQRPLSLLYLPVSSGEVSNTEQSYVKFRYERFYYATVQKGFQLE
jgi:hypothetical protein